MSAFARSKLVLLAALGAIFSVPPAAAAPHVVQAVPGKTVGIGHYVSTSGSCAQGPVPWINITVKPTNGSITTDLGPVLLDHLDAGSTSCVGKTMKGLLVFYTANPGFHGVEHIQYRVDYFPRGNGVYDIDVQVK